MRHSFLGLEGFEWHKELPLYLCFCHEKHLICGILSTKWWLVSKRNLVLILREKSCKSVMWQKACQRYRFLNFENDWFILEYFMKLILTISNEWYLTPLGPVLRGHAGDRPLCDHKYLYKSPNIFNIYHPWISFLISLPADFNTPNFFEVILKL